MSAPTFINLPPPPSDPVTPSDLGPGTPNSGTTSMSTLSTTAIKDGHQGHAPPHAYTYNQSVSTLDAERADRISRLAGLERVATLRGTTSHSALCAAPIHQQQPPGYFDHAGLPGLHGLQQGKEKSTIDSASTTEIAGGRIPWAGGSETFEIDKMSEGQEDEVSSTAGLSDGGNASLVGFGEAASSTVSGPVSRSSVLRSESRVGNSAIVKATYADEGDTTQRVLKPILTNEDTPMQDSQDERRDKPAL